MYILFVLSVVQLGVLSADHAVCDLCYGVSLRLAGEGVKLFWHHFLTTPCQRENRGHSKILVLYSLIVINICIQLTTTLSSFATFVTYGYTIMNIDNSCYNSWC